MNQTITQQRSIRRAQRVRAKITGTAERPRLAVRISNRHIWAQLIDDVAGKTLVAASSLSSKEGSLSERAAQVGESVAEAAKKSKVSKVVLDRGSHLYHRRLQAFAEAARKKGLEF